MMNLTQDQYHLNLLRRNRFLRLDTNPSSAFMVTGEVTGTLPAAGLGIPPTSLRKSSSEHRNRSEVASFETGLADRVAMGPSSSLSV